MMIIKACQEIGSIQENWKYPANISTKDSHNKDRDGRDLVDTEEVKKRWKEYTEEPDYYDGVVSHPGPDILECEVKWALGITAVNKTSGCNEILAELVKSLKDDAINILHLLCQQIWKAKQWPQDWKRSIFIPLPKKSSTKECANHQTVALISHASNAHA